MRELIGSGATDAKLVRKKMLLNADWSEYAQWLLGRRRRFVVRETSMVPTLMPGDTVLAEMGVPVHVGDIVVVRWNGDTSIASKPVNKANEDSSLLLVKRVSEIFYDGCVYLISDNADEPNARDSRHFGVMATNHILGRVTSRLASLS
ncbi:MAG: S24/S26 family peptidase [Cyanobacteria bacterium P01_H01_bin.21]